MRIENDYERLVREGYKEAGSLTVDVSNLIAMNVTSEPLEVEHNHGKQRYDKSVVITDSGKEKKVSSLMMGYNKQNIVLADGSYMNSDELIEAMEAAVARLDKGTVVVSKKGKLLDIEAFRKFIDETITRIRIGIQSTKIDNQMAKNWSIQTPSDGKEYSKGIVFLGNDGTNLNGDYISSQDFFRALNEYVVMMPEKEILLPPSSEPAPVQNRNRRVVRVVRKYKNQLSKSLLALAITATFLTGFRINVNTQQFDKSFSQLILNYGISDTAQIKDEITTDDLVRDLLANTHMGSNVNLEEGDILKSNSTLNGKSLEIGEHRQAGLYEVSGFSIVKDGKMLTFLEDYNIESPGMNLDNFINDYCQKSGLSLSDINIRLHMGNSKNNTRSGWIDITDLIRQKHIDDAMINYIAQTGSTYNGTTENVWSSTITFSTLEGDVTINIKDSMGNYLLPGSRVIGSDGKEYIIGELQENIVNHNEQGLETKKQLTWKIQDCNLLVGLLPLLGAIGVHVATKKKNEEVQKNPQFFEFTSETEYHKFKSQFIEAKEKYEKKSGFKKMLKNIFYRKEYDVLQNLNEEQIQTLYSIIRNLNDSNYRYEPRDQIQFKNGKIVIIRNGLAQDITDLVLPSIASIGRDNDIEAEGLLVEGEKKSNGIRSK